MPMESRGCMIPSNGHGLCHLRRCRKSCYLMSKEASSRNEGDTRAYEWVQFCLVVGHKSYRQVLGIGTNVSVIKIASRAHRSPSSLW